MGDHAKKSEEEQVDERLLAIKLLGYRNPILKEFHDFIFPCPSSNFTSEKLSKKSNKSKRSHESQHEMIKKQKINDSDSCHVNQWTVSFFVIYILCTIYDIEVIYLFDEVCGELPNLVEGFREFNSEAITITT